MALYTPVNTVLKKTIATLRTEVTFIHHGLKNCQIADIDSRSSTLESLKSRLENVNTASVDELGLRVKTAGGWGSGDTYSFEDPLCRELGSELLSANILYLSLIGHSPSARAQRGDRNGAKGRVTLYLLAVVEWLEDRLPHRGATPLSPVTSSLPTPSDQGDCAAHTVKELTASTEYTIDQQVEARVEGLRASLSAYTKERIEVALAENKVAAEEDMMRMMEAGLEMDRKLARDLHFMAENHRTREGRKMREALESHAEETRRMREECEAALEAMRHEALIERAGHQAEVQEIRDRSDGLKVQQASLVNQRQWSTTPVSTKAPIRPAPGWRAHSATPSTPPPPVSYTKTDEEVDLRADLADLRKEFEAQKERSLLVNKRMAEEVKVLKQEVSSIRSAQAIITPDNKANNVDLYVLGTQECPSQSIKTLDPALSPSTGI